MSDIVAQDPKLTHCIGLPYLVSLMPREARAMSAADPVGDRHNHDDLPVLLAGAGGGYAPPGQHKVYSSEQPIANLYIAMAEAAGVAMGPFGQDGTGPLDLS
jgi:hypothetical protein